METLLAHGADLSFPAAAGSQPLAAAAYMGNEPLVRASSWSTAPIPNTLDTTGKSPICYAGGRGFTRSFACCWSMAST